MTPAFEKIISDELVGEVCKDFRFVEGGTLILFIGDGSGSRSSRVRLWIDGAWRLRQDRSIRIGSLDHSETILEELQRLVGRVIESVNVDSISGDLRIGIEGTLVLESFSRSVVDESWELRRADGLRLGVGPNHEPFHRWEQPDSSIESSSPRPESET